MTFPFAATGGAQAAAVPAAAPDRGAALAESLGDMLARLAPDAAIVVAARARSGDFGARARSGGVSMAAVAMRRADGLEVAVSIAPALAEAVASAQLGGAFSADAATGSTRSATAQRAQRALLLACLDAVDSQWAGGAGWAPASAMPEGPALGFDISAPGFAAGVDLVIVEAVAAAATPGAALPRADAAWQRGMRALLGATGLPLRAVLHERQLALSQAVQLAPGDVLPIEAPREVQLRIGTHKIARGTIAPLGDDGALLVTITSRRPDPALLETLEVQP